jgi:hypothetical protein
MQGLIPTQQEIRRWVTETLNHTYKVEYFLNEISKQPGFDYVNMQGPDRPHDMVGWYNKLSHPMVWAEALSCRLTDPRLSAEHSNYINGKVSHAINEHRKQDHHVMWNGHISEATPYDLVLGAVDTAVAKQENRSHDINIHLGANPYRTLKEIVMDPNNGAIYRNDLQEKALLKVLPIMEKTMLPQYLTIEKFLNSNSETLRIPQGTYIKMKHKIEDVVKDYFLPVTEQQNVLSFEYAPAHNRRCS